MNILDPRYMKGFNDGLTQAKKEATNALNEFLTERMESLTNIPGIGPATAEKIHFHFIERLYEK